MTGFNVDEEVFGVPINKRYYSKVGVVATYPKEALPGEQILVVSRKARSGDSGDAKSELFVGLWP